MELNNDKLSSGERAEMRDLLTTGARRMKAARARRTQLASVAAAVVLVAAVVTGVSFAALNPIDRVAEPVETTSTPTPTTTPTPTPTPTPTATPDPVPEAPAAAVQPFGGECANVLSIERVSDWMGVEMEPAPATWTDPDLSMSGGISCAWRYPGALGWGNVSVTAFPASLFPPSEPAPEASGDCPDARACTAAALIDDMWINIVWNGPLESWRGDPPLRLIGPAELGDLFVTLSESAGAYPSPRTAERAAAWWPDAGCQYVADALPDGARMEVTDRRTWNVMANPVEVRSRAGLGVDRCGFSDDLVELEIIPGGAVTFDAIAASSGAQPVDVQGSDGATLVRGNSSWSDSGHALVVRAGANLLIVRALLDQDGSALTELVQIAEPAIAALNATLG